MLGDQHRHTQFPVDPDYTAPPSHVSAQQADGSRYETTCVGVEVVDVAIRLRPVGQRRLVDSMTEVPDAITTERCLQCDSGKR